MDWYGGPMCYNPIRSWERDMTYLYKEDTFPDGYRATEVGQVLRALSRLRSITITGLAGMGKSNVVRFIVSHPLAPMRYLTGRSGHVAFIHVDCTGLAHDDEDELLAEVLAQWPAPEPSGLLPSPLRRALKERLLRLPPEMNLALFFDYFDQIASSLNPSFFNYLIYLRNSRPQANLSYVFVTRRPLPRLADELQELLDDPCYVGPLAHADALASIGRDEARLDAVFIPPERDALLACSGGHPGLLKNACELAASRQVDLESPQAQVIPQLLASAKVRSLCQELWDDLMPDEQTLVGRLAAGAAPSAVPGSWSSMASWSEVGRHAGVSSRPCSSSGYGIPWRAQPALCASPLCRPIRR